MFDKFGVGPEHLKRRRERAERMFSNKNPTPSNTFSAEEEKMLSKMMKPVMNKGLAMISGEMYHEQINDIVQAFQHKANYDFSKMDKKYTKKIDEMYNLFQRMMKKEQRLENTCVGVFCDAYNILKDPKIIKTCQKFKPYVEDFIKKTKEKVPNPKSKGKTSTKKKYTLKEILRHKKDTLIGFGVGSAVVVGVVGILSVLWIVLTVILALLLIVLLTVMVIELFKITKGTEDPLDEKEPEKFYNMICTFEKDNAVFIKNIVYPAVDAIAFFKSMSPERYFNAVMNAGKSKEELDRMGVEDYRLSDQDIEDIQLEHGTEDFGLILAVGAGIALLAMLLVPSLRNFVYFIESWHVDMSDFYNEEAELLTNNVASLKERLEATKDEKERKRLEKVIEKQEIYILKMRQKADKHYVREIDAEKQAEIAYSNDENLFEEEDQAEDMPDIII